MLPYVAQCASTTNCFTRRTQIGVNRQMQAISRWLMAFLLLSGPVVVDAAGLVAVTGGQLVNDTDHDITWTADGNLFLTQATQSGDAAALVATIINDWGGGGLFTGNGYSYTMTAADFNTSSGAMTWFGTIAWV